MHQRAEADEANYAAEEVKTKEAEAAAAAAREAKVRRFKADLG